MPLTVEQMKALVVSEVYRDDTPAFKVTIKTDKITFRSLVNDWWTLYEDKHAVNTRLGYLYVKRHALEYLRDSVWPRRTHRAFDRNSSDSDLAKIFIKLIDQVSIEINILEGNKSGGRDGLYQTGSALINNGAAGGEAGELTTLGAGTTTAIATGGADQNAQGYIGSPIISTGTARV